MHKGAKTVSTYVNSSKKNNIPCGLVTVQMPGIEIDSGLICGVH